MKLDPLPHPLFLNRQVDMLIGIVNSKVCYQICCIVI